MKPHSTAFVLLLLVAHGLHAADDAAFKEVVKAKVREINDAVIAGDFGKVADLTYPKVVEMMGGREKVISTSQAKIKEAREKGFEYRSVKVEDPSDSIKSGSYLFAVAPFVMEMKIPGGRLFQRTFVIGISPDAGKTWSFINGDLDIKLVKQILPSLPDELKLPEKQKPVFEKD